MNGHTCRHMCRQKRPKYASRRLAIAYSHCPTIPAFVPQGAAMIYRSHTRIVLLSSSASKRSLFHIIDIKKEIHGTNCNLERALYPTRSSVLETWLPISMTWGKNRQSLSVCVGFCLGSSSSFGVTSRETSDADWFVAELKG